ncbi:cytochrome P450 [Mycena epipterygia]|nr:cytochrome P450 [Mycena epipterygia]
MTHSIDFAPAIGATAGLAIILYNLHSRLTRSKLPLPPGPRKLPIVGNIFDLPPAFEWKTYQDWSRQYNSDIIQLDLAGKSVIVLSSLEATDDLLEKRSSIYSGRSPLPMLIDLMDWTFALRDVWRAHRRLFNQGFNARASRNFRPKELAATHELLRRLVHTPEAFRDHIRRMAAEIIISVAYGIDVLPVNDPYIAVAEKAVHAGVQASIPGRFLVDSIPLLKYVPDWFPGAGFKQKAKEWKQLGRELESLPFVEVKRQLAAGTASYSFSSESLRILSESDDKYYDEDTVRATAASMFIAGSDTTVAALSTFFLAMLANPEAQRKAQMEINMVIGQGQLPDFNDEQSLPYVSALVKEVLRWKPVAPIGLQSHRCPTVDLNSSLVEDEYRGYRLPAGSIIIGNIWAILQDEDMYPDPSVFKPERFLRDGKPNPDVRDPQAVFGFGRRICPARHMALESVWITIASILSVFDITKAVGDDGQIIEPSYQYSPDLISLLARHSLSNVQSRLDLRRLWLWLKPPFTAGCETGQEQALSER